jgi:Protein of unknown function (DUF1656)
MWNTMPHEFDIGGVYLPPLLIAGGLALIAARFTAGLLTRYRLVQHFANPPLVSLALVVIYTMLIGTFVIPG